MRSAVMTWLASTLGFVVLDGVWLGLALPRATDLGSAALAGAGLGLVVYGVYDLTNLSTLAAWPVAVTVADIVWGIVATAAVSAAVYAWHAA